MFPEEFWWGVSESGFQFEMGDPEGRYIDPNTDWYVWVHDEDNIRSGLVSGDLPENGIDYFTRYKIDHKIAEELGLNTYRLGIEWSRIFPKPTLDIEVDIEEDDDKRPVRVKVGDEAIERLDALADHRMIKHYRDIIEDLRIRGFRVIVCLNHFTLPLWIHDPIKARDTRLRNGPLGWLEYKTIVEFTKYAAYIAYKLGDLIDDWATLNEPVIVAETGYLQMEAFPPYVRDMGFPPRLKNSAFGKALINMVYAHKNAYDAIKQWDREYAYQDSPTPARVGLIHNVMPIHPYREDNDTDLVTADFLSHIHNRYFLEAVTRGWIDRDFDGEVDRGEMETEFSNHLDWLGVNYYCRVVVKGRMRFLAKIATGLPAFFDPMPGYGFTAGDLGRDKSLDGYPVTDIGWEIYPKGLRQALELAGKYKVPIIVTENGLADSTDKYRAQFIISHLKVLQDIIEEGSVNVYGYLHWALTDNYEWAHGFKMRFGLVHVDLKSKERTPRPSSRVYKEIIAKAGVPKSLIDQYGLMGSQ